MMKLRNRTKFGILVFSVIFIVASLIFLFSNISSQDICPKGSEGYLEVFDNGNSYASGCVDVNNQKVGTWFYYEDSLLSKFGKYGNDMAQGEWKYYLKDGKTVAYVENYKDGMLDGKIIYYYSYDKKIKRSEDSYCQGILSGDFAKYYEDGNLKLKGTYGVIEKDGRKIGVYDGELYYFNENGDIENIEYYNLGEKIEKLE